MARKVWFYLDSDAGRDSIEHAYPSWVNRNRSGVVLISDVSLDEVGLEDLEEISGVNYEALKIALKRGAVCDVVVGDPVKIMGLFYDGKVQFSNGREYETFLHFLKNGANVYIFADHVNFLTIDGNTVEE